MADLNGCIGSSDLLVMIQFLSDQRRTGRLCLGESSQSAELDFENGRLVAASFGDTHGLPAISALLQAFRDGQMSFFYRDDPLRAWCPKLGFFDDPSGHHRRPSPLHRCFADGRPQPIASKEQSQFCLNGCFSACPRFKRSQGEPAPNLTWTTSMTRDPH
jgi:Domain of unknown function (DUF4388)